MNLEQKDIDRLKNLFSEIPIIDEQHGEYIFKGLMETFLQEQRKLERENKQLQKDRNWVVSEREKMKIIAQENKLVYEHLNKMVEKSNQVFTTIKKQILSLTKNAFLTNSILNDCWWEIITFQRHHGWGDKNNVLDQIKKSETNFLKLMTTVESCLTDLYWDHQILNVNDIISEVSKNIKELNKHLLEQNAVQKEGESQ